MKNRWQDKEFKDIRNSILKQRVYSSRLIGMESGLAQPGYGSSSVKTITKDLLGSKTSALAVTGEGSSLDEVTDKELSLIHLEVLRQISRGKGLRAEELMLAQKAHLLNPEMPLPSMEAVIHGVIPFDFVDYVPAVPIIALTRAPDADKTIAKLFGKSVLVIPDAVSPVNIAKEISNNMRGIDRSTLEAIIVINHGIITFHNSAKTAYQRLIKLVTKAEKYLNQKKKRAAVLKPTADPLMIAGLRKEVSKAHGHAVQAVINSSNSAVSLSLHKKAVSLTSGGPLIPDQVIDMKPFPCFVTSDIGKSVENFKKKYEKYHQSFSSSKLEPGKTAPNWAVWPGAGCAAFGRTYMSAQSRAVIAGETAKAILQADSLGGCKSIPQKNLFALENSGSSAADNLQNPEPSPMDLTGKVALVSGSAAGIGLAIARTLHSYGASVVGIDLSPDIVKVMDQPNLIGIQCDITNKKKVKAAVESIVTRFGGLDILVSNAGIFTAGRYIEEMDDSWNKSMNVNLTSAMQLLGLCVPYLKLGVDPAVVFVGSRNVAAPGAGAASYSVAKAGLQQLARVAALELCKDGIRVNTVHPDAVFDTKLWTPEVLARSAKRYGITVQEYKTKNLMKTEITSKDVANMVCAMAGAVFGKTTGAGVPLDGGNDRVI